MTSSASTNFGWAHLIRTGLKLVTLLGLSLTVPALAQSPDIDRSPAAASTQSLVALSHRYDRSNAAQRAQLLEEMIELARERRKQLTTLASDRAGDILRYRMPESARARLPAVVQDLLEQEINVQGTLSALIEHGADGSRTHYMFADKSGNTHALHFGAESKMPRSGGRVQISGLLLESNDNEEDSQSALVPYAGSAGLQYLAPEEDQSSGSTGGTVGEVVNPIGEQPTLVLLVNFEDTAAETPFSVTDAHDAVFGTVNDFFTEASYAKTWLTGDVHGWFTLPIPSTCNTIDITNAADTAATANGIDLSAYGRLLYVMKGGAQCFWSGASNMWVYPSRAWLNGNLDPMVIAHEMGHGFGLNHSNLLECGDTVLGDSCSKPKDDKFDVMGAAPEPGHFNAFQKERLGWLTAEDLVTVTGDGTYEIEPMELDAGVKALKILKETDPAGEGATWFYLEYRRALGFDSFIAGNANVENGVLVHTGADFDSASSLLLDMTPNSSVLSFIDRSDPALITGQSFADPASGVGIVTSSADASGSTVTITVGQSDCVRGDPVVAISPPGGEWVTPGTSVVYEVTVTSSDTGACAPAVFDLSSTLPVDWTGEFDSAALNVAPGSSSSAALTVMSSLAASDAIYDVVVTSTNGADPDHVNSATAVYAVSSGTSNQPPTATNDDAETAMNTVITVDVLANDMDPDGDQLSVSDIVQAANGSVNVNSDGTVTYSPRRRFKGTDSFSYTITDGVDFATATATVAVRKSGGGNGGDGNGKGKGKSN